MKKSPLEKLIVDTLKRSFYLNVACPKDWGLVPCWKERFCGSDKKSVAVALRYKWLKELQEKGSSEWGKRDLKTVRITLCKIY